MSMNSGMINNTSNNAMMNHPMMQLLFASPMCVVGSGTNNNYNGGVVFSSLSSKTDNNIDTSSSTESKRPIEKDKHGAATNSANNKKVAMKNDETEADRPKRARSAYNYFFRSERAKLLGITLEELDRQEQCSKRKHRKTPGMMGFANLASYVGDKWRQLTEQEKEPFQQMCDKDRERYNNDLQEWRNKNNNTKHDGSILKEPREGGESQASMLKAGPCTSGHAPITMTSSSMNVKNNSTSQEDNGFFSFVSSDAFKLACCERSNDAVGTSIQSAAAPASTAAVATAFSVKNELGNNKKRKHDELCGGGKSTTEQVLSNIRFCGSTDTFLPIVSSDGSNKRHEQDSSNDQIAICDKATSYPTTSNMNLTYLSSPVQDLPQPKKASMQDEQERLRHLAMIFEPTSIRDMTTTRATAATSSSMQPLSASSSMTIAPQGQQQHTISLRDLFNLTNEVPQWQGIFQNLLQH